MRPIHEIAVIKDGNEVVGFVVGHKDNLVDMNIWRYSKLHIISMSEMEKLVKEDKVQYFEWDYSKNKLKINYTPEEIAMIKRSIGKSGLELVEKTKTLQDYFKNDVTLKKKHVAMIKHKVGVAGALVNNIEMPLIGGIYGLILIGDENFGDMLNNWIGNQDKQVRKQINPVYIEKDNATIMVSEKVYTKLAYALNICICVATSERDKPSGIIGLMYGSGKSMTSAYNKIEPLNKKILEIAKQGVVS